MRTKIKIVAFSCLLLGLVSCKKHSMQLEEYVAFMSSDKDVIKEKEISGITYALKLQTPESMVLRKYHYNAQNFNAEIFKAETEKLGNELYYFITIKDAAPGTRVKNLVTDKMQYMENLGYMSGELQKDLMLVTDKGDTLLSSLYHMEPPSTLKPELNIALSFNYKAGAEGFSVIMNDELFKNGPVKFYVKAGEITNLPKLNYSTK